MKKYILILLFAMLPVSSYATHASLVVDTRTGEVLVGRNQDMKNYPASLTKVMTLYIAFSAMEQGLLDWNDELYVSSYASRQPKSKLYLKKGDTITVEEAVKAMIVRSANDAAVVLAEAIGGTEENFAETMNGFAQVLGMEHTSFSNASGLTNNGYTSSASDMIRLAIAIRQHFPQYYELFSLKQFTFKNKKMRTTNNILRTYKGAEGLKTGYTNKAGYNLISAASNEKGHIMAIAMDRRSVKDRDNSMVKMLNLGFKRLETNKEEISKKQELIISKARLGSKDIIEKNISHSKRLASASEEQRRKLMVLKDGGGKWGIQVGAFYKKKQAIDAAKTVFAKYFNTDDREIKVSKTRTKRGRVIYKSIIAGLSKHNAYEVCVDYKKCFIVKPKEDTDLAQIKH